MQKKKVLILGGGVAGMSAAHELIRRGFEVEVFEKQKKIAGGKARSVPVPDTGTDGRAPLPGEHGFRFFPGFYKHVTATMKEIPFGTNKHGVLDNLVDAETVMMARYDKKPVITLDDFPTNFKELLILLNAIFGSDLGLTKADIRFFADRIWQLMTSCRERRVAVYEKIGWWEYLEADQHSEAYQKIFAMGLTRSLVAAKAETASSKTVGDIFLQLLYGMLDPSIETDRLLNAPTNAAWIDPWLTYLEERGVKYHLGYVADRINMAKAQLDEEGVTKDAQISSITIKSEIDGSFFDISADYYLFAMPVERMAELIRKDITLDPTITDLKELEKLKYNSPLLKTDPTLLNILKLSKNTSWMNGIQFYLSKYTPINKGHVIYVDTPWALTSVSQKQFWDQVDLSKYGNGKVKDILSVDISDWFAAGTFNGKKASACSRDEIVKEVWAQLKESLMVDGESMLKDEDLVDSYLDQDIVFFSEEKEKQREQVLEQIEEYKANEQGDQVVLEKRQIAKEESPDVVEPAFKTKNKEPLLINVVNSWSLRPEAYTRVPNMFLASDYVRTNTDLATMEGANEAARRAVNCILDASGSHESYCKIWDLHEPNILAILRWRDSNRFKKGLPWSPELFLFQRIALAYKRLELKLKKLFR